MKKYRVTLTGTEREELAALLVRGKADVRKLKHAQVLLRADGGEAADGAGAGWCDIRIAEAVCVGVGTVHRLRQRFVEEGFAAALGTYRTGARVYERKLDGAQEAHLIALACGAAPDGRARWTLRLLASRMVELRHADAVSHETVRQVLKNALKPHLRRMWCIPPKQSAEFVFHVEPRGSPDMEDVLEVYHRPCDPKRPVVCMDETFKQLIGETREPLPPRPGSPACEPLVGWRHVAAAAHRCCSDWAMFIRDPLDGRYRDAERVALVMDQLNTHSQTPLSLSIARRWLGHGWLKANRPVLGSSNHTAGCCHPGEGRDPNRSPGGST